MRLVSRSIFNHIDPRIQLHLERRARGIIPPATVSTNEGEIEVIAKVSNLDNWLSLSEVFAGANVGTTPDNCHIVTARVPLSQISKLRQLDYVVSIKASQLIQPSLRATVEEINAHSDSLSPISEGKQGKGVVVGIVDYGCDFIHQNFRHPDGTTRILALWDQKVQPQSEQNSYLGYGRVYSQAEINTALQSADPYTSLGYSPNRSSHGTHVMDIACGNGKGSNVPGVAPEADIVFVEISASDIPFQGPEVLDANFGGSVQLLEAIKFIFDRAGDSPCVVNVSLGTNGGPHDGSSLVEQGIDALVSEKPNRAVVIAASNSYEDGIHASGEITSGSSVDLVWQIDDFDFTHNEMEIWYDREDELQLELIDENEQSIGTVDIGASVEVLDDAGNLLFFVAHRQGDPNNGDNNIGIFMNTGVSNSEVLSQLKIRLHGIRVSNGKFHAWIERDDLGQSSFAAPNDNTHTLGSISCGRHSIVVGSYDAHSSGKPLSWFSSAGPTRDGRNKPEISAPGHNVWAANSTTRVGVTRKSGTSMAAPAVTGVVALMLAEACSLGKELTTEQIRQILNQTARSDPPSSTWHDRYGWGRVDAKGVIKEVRQI